MSSVMSGLNQITISVSEVNGYVPSTLTSALALGLIVADWSYNFRWEARLLQSRNRWKPSHIAYFASRLGGFAYSICALLLHVLGNSSPDHSAPTNEGVWVQAARNCQASKKAAISFGTVCIAGSSAILMLRCLALWRFNSLVIVPLGLVWLSAPAFSLVQLASLDETSPMNGLASCLALPSNLNHANDVLSYMPWLCLPIFDTLVLILTLLGLHRATGRRAPSALERLFRRDNIFYWLLNLFSVLPIPIIYFARPSDGQIGLLAYINVHMALTSVLSCRIFVNLWKAIGRELAIAQTYASGTGHNLGTYGARTLEGVHRSALSRIYAHDGPEGPLENHQAHGHVQPHGCTRPNATNVNPNSHNRFNGVWGDIDPDLAFSLSGGYGFGDTTSFAAAVAGAGMGLEGHKAYDDKELLDYPTAVGEVTTQGPFPAALFPPPRAAQTTTTGMASGAASGIVQGAVGMGMASSLGLDPTYLAAHTHGSRIRPGGRQRSASLDSPTSLSLERGGVAHSADVSSGFSPRVAVVNLQTACPRGCTGVASTDMGQPAAFNVEGAASAGRGSNVEPKKRIGFAAEPSIPAHTRPGVSSPGSVTSGKGMRGTMGMAQQMSPRVSHGEALHTPPSIGSGSITHSLSGAGSLRTLSDASMGSAIVAQPPPILLSSSSLGSATGVNLGSRVPSRQPSREVLLLGSNGASGVPSLAMSPSRAAGNIILGEQEEEEEALEDLKDADSDEGGEETKCDRNGKLRHRGGHAIDSGFPPGRSFPQPPSSSTSSDGPLAWAKMLTAKARHAAASVATVGAQDHTLSSAATADEEKKKKKEAREKAKALAKAKAKEEKQRIKQEQREREREELRRRMEKRDATMSAGDVDVDDDGSFLEDGNQTRSMWL
ncbi:hypothetical protein IE53DRAFT_388547 [Violaceomyces palustris]|uniref:Uncharacterized protein n=1 Tax=Violaceomyces palustris TaxID=1673888 RepID=A0ACD0NTX2_9BASI|nr:hypothetical protein IE53DRAFT_388547 [Violaceomyces palustris]